jgi:hypothetical protein
MINRQRLLGVSAFAMTAIGGHLVAAGTGRQASPTADDDYTPPTITPELAAQLERAKARELERRERDAIERFSARDIEDIWQAEERRRRRKGRKL